MESQKKSGSKFDVNIYFIDNDIINVVADNIDFKDGMMILIIGNGVYGYNTVKINSFDITPHKEDNTND